MGALCPRYFYYITRFHSVSILSVYIVEVAGLFGWLIAQFFNAAHAGLKGAHIVLVNLLPAELFVDLGLFCPVGKGHGQIGVLANDLCFFEAGHGQRKKGLIASHIRSISCQKGKCQSLSA